MPAQCEGIAAIVIAIFTRQEGIKWHILEGSKLDDAILRELKRRAVERQV